MFCPGIANLPDGRILVSGGNSDEKTSVYNSDTDRWEEAPKMQIGRGYHSSLTLSRNDRWQKLTGINTNPMSTDDARAQYRADNHMWLFAWQNGRTMR